MREVGRPELPGTLGLGEIPAGLARLLVGHMPPQAAYTELVRIIGAALKAEAVLLYLVRDGELQIAAHNGPVPAARLPLSPQAAGAARLSSAAQVITRAYAEQRPHHAAILAIKADAAESGLQSVLAVPIRLGDSVLGVLAVGDKSTAVWAPETLERLSWSAPVAAAVVAVQKEREHRSHREREAVALIDIVRAVSSNLDLEALMHTLVYRTAAAMGKGPCTAALLDDTGQWVVPRWSTVDLSPYGHVAEKYAPEAVGGAPCSAATWVLTAGKPLLLLRKDPRHQHISSEILDAFQCEAAMLVPISTDDQPLGIFLIHANEPLSFREYDVQFLQVVAAQAAVAIRNARLYESAKAEAQRREALYEITKSITASLNWRQVLDLILRKMSALYPKMYADIGLLTDDGQELVSYRDGDRVDVNNSLGGLALTERRPMVSHDVNSDPRVAQENARQFQILAAITAPMITRQRRYGCLYLGARTNYRFSEAELAFLQAVAESAAIALENARLYEEAQRLAVTDAVTGLSNRQYVDQCLNRELKRAQRYNTSFTVVMMDLDRFKQINDTHGHQVGDEVLRQVAAVIRRCVRGADVAARYGGEEFLLLMPETTLAQAAQAMERIRRAVAAETDPPVTLSGGVAAYDPQHPSDVLRSADAAMYAAKNSGGNQVYLVEPEGMAAYSPAAGEES